MSTLKAAVAGTGFMGVAHTEALRRLGVPVLGCAGSTPARGQALMERLGLPRFYESFEALVGDPEVDVVHICTPNHLHLPMVQAAFQAGKHVICEKPLANSSSESAAMVRLEREQGVVGAVCYNLRYYPLCQDAHSRIHAGEIGAVRLVHGGYLQDWLFYPTDWNWRLDTAQGGPSRTVADIGTHWLDMVMWLTGLRVTAVMADLATFLSTRLKPAHAVETFAGKLAAGGPADEVPVSSEDCGLVLLELQHGARGVMLVSQISAGRKNHFHWEVAGSRASIAWGQETPNHLWLGHRDRPNELVIKDPALMREDARPSASYPGGHAEGYPDTFKQCFRAVYEYLAAGDFNAPRTFPTLRDGHHEIVLVEAILRSSRERRWVEVAY